MVKRCIYCGATSLKKIKRGDPYAADRECNRCHRLQDSSSVLHFEKTRGSSFRGVLND